MISMLTTSNPTESVPE